MPTTFRAEALKTAHTQIGVKEHPAGTNSGPKVNEYLRSCGLGPGYPWCMAFMHWCFRKSGLILRYPNPASVGFFEEWAADNGYLVRIPGPGDLACYRFDADNWPDHVGIVSSVNRVSRRIAVIEGNTALGDDANGGMVMVRLRDMDGVKFVRIPGERQVKKPVVPYRVDVWVNGELRLKRQNPMNPLVLKRLQLWIKDKATVTVRGSK